MIWLHFGVADMLSILLESPLPVRLSSEDSSSIETKIKQLRTGKQFQGLKWSYIIVRFAPDEGHCLLNKDTL